VNWADVGKLLAVSAALTVVVLAAIKFLPIIPAARKKLLYFFAVLVIWTPVGLITPGVAYGEWSSDSLPGIGYSPQGLARLGGLWQAPFAGYQLPWVSGSASLSEQAPGYIFSGVMGMLLIFGATWLLGRWLARREQSNARTDN
jgi:cobalt/nickel transport protein